MLQADLRGKIPTSLVNSEDLLTSSILGSIRYLSSTKAITKILERSMNVHSDRLQFFAEMQEVTYFFWQRLENSEPDVLLLFENQQQQYEIVCIEAKYLSGKSSEEDESIEVDERKNSQRDQLARQAEDLYKESTYHFLNIKGKDIISTRIVYLTNDTYLPETDMENSCRSIKNGFDRNNIYWLSWKEIYKVVCSIEASTAQDKLILSDIVSLCQRKNLVSFGGFPEFKKVQNSEWSYFSSKKEKDWNTLKNVTKCNWSYRGRQQ